MADLHADGKAHLHRLEGLFGDDLADLAAEFEILLPRLILGAEQQVGRRAGEGVGDGVQHAEDQLVLLQIFQLSAVAAVTHLRRVRLDLEDFAREQRFIQDAVDDLVEVLLGIAGVSVLLPEVADGEQDQPRNQAQRDDQQR